MTQKKSIIIKIAVVLIMIFASLMNGHLQLNRKVDKIEDVFTNGENKDNLSIKYDLQKIDDSMSYFLSLAKVNHVESENIKKLDQLHKEFDTIDAIVDYSKWYKEVKAVYPLAFSQVRSVQISKQHEEMLNKYEATYNSSIHTISYSPYNQYVEEYEKETDGILAKLIINITGVKKVTTFD